MPFKFLTTNNVKVSTATITITSIFVFISDFNVNLG